MCSTIFLLVFSQGAHTATQPSSRQSREGRLGSDRLQNPIPEVSVALRQQLGLVQAEPCVHCSTKDRGKELSSAEPREESRDGRHEVAVQEPQHSPASPALPLPTHTDPAPAAPTSIRSMSHRSRSWGCARGRRAEENKHKSENVTSGKALNQRASSANPDPQSHPAESTPSSIQGRLE